MSTPSPLLQRIRAASPGASATRGAGPRPTRNGGQTYRPGARRRPGQVVVGGFVVAVLLGAGLLLLPAASTTAHRPTILEALFTSTSAVCVTGLTVLDTATQWTTFGQVVIMGLIQVGGFGVMTLASLLGLLLSRRLNLQARLRSASATRSVGLGDVRRTLVGIGIVTAVIEGSVTLVLAARYVLFYGEGLGQALWLGAFHAVSAFNNAGFALFSDSLSGFATDPWISLPVTAAVIVGGIGFPVILELSRTRWRPRSWSLHTKITLSASAVLIVVGAAFVTVAEWTNPATLGPLDVRGKLLAGLFQGVMPRTAGFNSVDTGAMNNGTWLGTDVLMFIGGGSGSTAGGIKVTTFMVLFVVMWAELRGDPDAVLFKRRLAPGAQRQALAVVLLSMSAIAISAITITSTSPFTSDEVLFEVVSAFATVGLSTGITAELAPWHQGVLIVLMLAGRLGPVTLGAALALRERQRLIRFPEGAPIVG